MNLDTQSQLSKSTIYLHWIVGITMIGLLVTGVYMTENEVYSLYDIHKSIGALILFFVLWRVIWRIKNNWPVSVANSSNWEKLLAKVVHYTLLIGTVLMPISGFIMSAMGGFGVSVFGLELVAENPDPSNSMEMIPLNAGLAQAGHIIHNLAGDAVIISLVLHIVGAIKHQMIDKDGTLRRMLGAKV